MAALREAGAGFVPADCYFPGPRLLAQHSWHEGAPWQQPAGLPEWRRGEPEKPPGQPAVRHLLDSFAPGLLEAAELPGACLAQTVRSPAGVCLGRLRLIGFAPGRKRAKQKGMKTIQKH